MQMDRPGPLFVFACLCIVTQACEEEPIGQPCTFGWPQTNSGPACTDYPVCAPLQDKDRPIGQTPANNACPKDCINVSQECTNLICVASEVEQGTDPEQYMNGQCSTDVITQNLTPECATDAKWGCVGYCTKDCVSDASCPKGYRCTSMAPFNQTLNCEDEKLWGTECTSDCIDAGATVPATAAVCKSSVEGDPSFNFYEECNQVDYQTCCNCLCYNWCPLVTRKYCRRLAWDQENFPLGHIEKTVLNCKQEQ